MNISKLLNPVPNKKPRFDEDILVCDQYWLPTELIAYIISFFHHQFRPKFRLVSKKWYTAYEQYHRNRMFNDIMHVVKKRVAREQVLNAFVNYGHRLRWMEVYTSTLREILNAEPNFTCLIPNVTCFRVTINDGLPSQRLMGDVVAKLSKIKKIIVHEYGSTADEHFAEEFDKAVANIPQLESVFIHDSELDFNTFPGPNMKELANQILELVISVANIEPGIIDSTFKIFKNVGYLGLRGISNVSALKDITEMVVEEKNFPKLHILQVHSEFDLSHTDPIVNEEDGTMVTAMDLYLKICGIRRPRFELILGFILGACSTTDLALIEKEREFVVNLGKIGAEVLSKLSLTHYTPSGDYDPLTTLFYESAPRFPILRFLNSHISPTADTGPRIIEALNNPFLLPHLVGGYFYVDGTQAPEWKFGYNPTNPSRGVHFMVNEKLYEDKVRMTNENNNGIVPSQFVG